jgi:hypothetical protein
MEIWRNMRGWEIDIIALIRWKFLSKLFSRNEEFEDSTEFIFGNLKKANFSQLNKSNISHKFPIKLNFSPFFSNFPRQKSSWMIKCISDQDQKICFE